MPEPKGRVALKLGQPQFVRPLRVLKATFGRS
jgi:hypothetical protein